MNTINILKAKIERRMTDNCVLAKKTKSFGQRAVEDNEILAIIDRLPAEKPAQGWSNQDEAMRNRVMYYIHYFQTHEGDTKEAQECMTWIKQLLGQARPAPAEESPKADLEAEIDREIQKLHTAPCYDELRNFARHFVDWQSKRVCEYIRECLEPVQQCVDDWDASGIPYTSSYHYDRGKVRGYKDILRDLESGGLDKYMLEKEKEK